MATISLTQSAYRPTCISGDLKPLDSSIALISKSEVVFTLETETGSPSARIAVATPTMITSADGHTSRILRQVAVFFVALPESLTAIDAVEDLHIHVGRTMKPEPIESTPGAGEVFTALFANKEAVEAMGERLRTYWLRFTQMLRTGFSNERVNAYFTALRICSMNPEEGRSQIDLATLNLAIATLEEGMTL